MTDETEQTSEGWIDKVPNDLIGALVKRAMSDSVVDIQDQLRQVGEQFIQRNDLFTAKVQSKRRVTIPEASAEKLGIEEGDLVQFVITPVESQIDNKNK